MAKSSSTSDREINQALSATELDVAQFLTDLYRGRVKRILAQRGKGIDSSSNANAGAEIGCETPTTTLVKGIFHDDDIEEDLEEFCLRSRKRRRSIEAIYRSTKPLDSSEIRSKKHKSYRSTKSLDSSEVRINKHKS